tara:strand:- start:88 stop:420 length:333 start_codon:yes stop_codon:yes gene_type:complete
MAIDNNSRLIAASKLQSNNAPALGCGAVVVLKDETLPDGDYVAFQATTDTAPITLKNVVYNGAGIEFIDGSPFIPIGTFSSRIGTTIWYANIKSCKNLEDHPVVFYRRCK